MFLKFLKQTSIQDCFLINYTKKTFVADAVGQIFANFDKFVLKAPMLHFLPLLFEICTLSLSPASTCVIFAIWTKKIIKTHYFSDVMGS